MLRLFSVKGIICWLTDLDIALILIRLASFVLYVCIYVYMFFFFVCFLSVILVHSSGQRGSGESERETCHVRSKERTSSTAAEMCLL